MPPVLALFAAAMGIGAACDDKSSKVSRTPKAPAGESGPAATLGAPADIAFSLPEQLGIRIGVAPFDGILPAEVEGAVRLGNPLQFEATDAGGAAIVQLTEPVTTSFVVTAADVLEFFASDPANLMILVLADGVTYYVVNKTVTVQSLGAWLVEARLSVAAGVLVLIRRPAEIPPSYLPLPTLPGQPTTPGGDTPADPTALAAPTITPAAGTFDNAQTVAIAAAPADAFACYRTDGTEPACDAARTACAPGSTLYQSAFAVDQTVTVKAIACRPGNLPSSTASAALAFAAIAPVATPSEGAYATAQSVALATATSGASIHYTSDGSDPTCASGTIYSAPIAVPQTTTLKAVACKTGYTASSVQTFAFTVTLAPAATPLVSPPTGTYDNDRLTSITTATAGAVICYRIDGTDPACNPARTGCAAGSTQYTTSFTTTSSANVKAIACKADLAASAVSSSVITLRVATPGFSPAAGTYATGQSVTLITTTSGATIRYTTSGVDPNCSTSTIYSAAIPVASTTTVKAIGCRAGFSDSTVQQALYTIVDTVSAPLILPATGTYDNDQSVSLSSATPGATICYRSDATSPACNGTLDGCALGSTVYSAPFLVSATATVRAIACKPGSTTSSVTANVITLRAAMPVATPGTGSYSLPMDVALATTTAGTSMRYTTDGNDPTCLSTEYLGNLAIVPPVTLKAIACKAGYAASTVMTAVYSVSVGGGANEPWVLDRTTHVSPVSALQRGHEAASPREIYAWNRAVTRTLFLSMDGGSTWSDISGGAQARLGATEYIDSLSAHAAPGQPTQLVALTTQGAVIASANGGIVWTPVVVDMALCPTSGVVRGVMRDQIGTTAVVQCNDGMVSDDVLVLVSLDGFTWQLKATLPDWVADYVLMEKQGPYRVIAVGNTAASLDLVTGSSNGGTTWFPPVPHSPCSLNAPSLHLAPDGTVFRVNGTNDMICRSTDGGVSWASFPSPGFALGGTMATDSLIAVSATEVLAYFNPNGWPGAAPGAFYRTTDAGANWAPVLGGGGPWIDDVADVESFGPNGAFVVTHMTPYTGRIVTAALTATTWGWDAGVPCNGNVTHVSTGLVGTAIATCSSHLNGIVRVLPEAAATLVQPMCGANPFTAFYGAAAGPGAYAVRTPSFPVHGAAGFSAAGIQRFRSANSGTNVQCLEATAGLVNFYGAVNASDSFSLISQSGVMLGYVVGDGAWTASTPPAGTKVNEAVYTRPKQLPGTPSTAFALVTGTSMAGGSNDQIYRTTNGGASWTRVKELVPRDVFRAVAFGSGMTGVAVGNGGALLRTTDGGANWSASTTMFMVDLNDVVMVNDKVGWLVGDSGTVAYTSDGGASWGTIASGTVEDLLSIDAVSPIEAWIGGAGGKLIRLAPFP